MASNKRLLFARTIIVHLIGIPIWMFVAFVTAIARSSFSRHENATVAELYPSSLLWGPIILTAMVIVTSVIMIVSESDFITGLRKKIKNFCNWVWNGFARKK